MSADRPEFRKPLIVGILNVTPDSFSDGGLFISESAAFLAAEKMIGEGADVIDVGGESSRPGAVPVPEAEELRRVLPVVKFLAQRFPTVRISIDTYKYQTAKVCVDAGATIVNDISGGADPRLPSLWFEGLDFILMHMLRDPQTMQRDPEYARGVTNEVREFLAARVSQFITAGVPRENLWIDPGIGFGKNLSHNLQLLAQIDSFSELGGRLMVGTSRKSFLARVLGDPTLSFEDRESGTLATNLWAYQKGASVFRVHNVGQFKRALDTWRAVEGENHESVEQSGNQFGEQPGGSTCLPPARPL